MFDYQSLKTYAFCVQRVSRFVNFKTGIKNYFLFSLSQNSVNHVSICCAIFLLQKIQAKKGQHPQLKKKFGCHLNEIMQPLLHYYCCIKNLPCFPSISRTRWIETFPLELEAHWVNPPLEEEPMVRRRHLLLHVTCFGTYLLPMP